MFSVLNLNAVMSIVADVPATTFATVCIAFLGCTELIYAPHRSSHVALSVVYTNSSKRVLKCTGMKLSSVVGLGLPCLCSHSGSSAPRYNPNNPSAIPVSGVHVQVCRHTASFFEYTLKINAHADGNLRSRGRCV